MTRRAWLIVAEVIGLAVLVVFPVCASFGYVTYTIVTSAGAPWWVAVPATAWNTVWVAWSTEAAWSVWRQRFGLVGGSRLSGRGDTIQP